jgi:hypothetical protein
MTANAIATPVCAAEWLTRPGPLVNRADVSEQVTHPGPPTH